MTSVQEAAVNMLNSTVTLCEQKDSDTALAAVPAIQTGINKVKANLGKIRANAALQLDKKTGAADKKQLRLSLNELTLTVSQGTFSFASATNNADLAQKTRYTKSAIDRIRDEDIKQTAQNIQDWASDAIAALAPYGITAAMLTTHLKLIDDYSGKISSPAITKATKKTAGENIKRLIKESTNILKTEVDPLVNGMIKTFPYFRTNYFNVRKIIDPARSKTRIAGTITDAKNDNVPIPNATVTLIIVKLPDSAPAGSPIPPPVTFKTKADGKFEFPAKAQTDYTIKAEATLFLTKSTDFVNVKLGTTKTVDIGLMPS